MPKFGADTILEGRRHCDHPVTMMLTGGEVFRGMLHPDWFRLMGEGIDSEGANNTRWLHIGFADLFEGVALPFGTIPMNTHRERPSSLLRPLEKRLLILLGWHVEEEQEHKMATTFLCLAVLCLFDVQWGLEGGASFRGSRQFRPCVETRNCTTTGCRWGAIPMNAQR